MRNMMKFGDSSRMKVNFWGFFEICWSFTSKTQKKLQKLLHLLHLRRLVDFSSSSTGLGVKKHRGWRDGQFKKMEDNEATDLVDAKIEI